MKYLQAPARWGALGRTLTKFPFWNRLCGEPWPLCGGSFHWNLRSNMPAETFLPREHTSLIEENLKMKNWQCPNTELRQEAQWRHISTASPATYLCILSDRKCVLIYWDLVLWPGSNIHCVATAAYGKYLYLLEDHMHVCKQRCYSFHVSTLVYVHDDIVPWSHGRSTILCKNAHANMHACGCLFMYVYMSECMHAWMSVCMHVRMSMYVHM